MCALVSTHHDVVDAWYESQTTLQSTGPDIRVKAIGCLVKQLRQQDPDTFYRALGGASSARLEHYKSLVDKVESGVFEGCAKYTTMNNILNEMYVDKMTVFKFQNSAGQLDASYRLVFVERNECVRIPILHKDNNHESKCILVWKPCVVGNREAMIEFKLLCDKPLATGSKRNVDEVEGRRRVKVVVSCETSLDATNEDIMNSTYELCIDDDVAQKVFLEKDTLRSVDDVFVPSGRASSQLECGACVHKQGTSNTIAVTGQCCELMSLFFSECLRLNIIMNVARRTRATMYADKGTKLKNWSIVPINQGKLITGNNGLVLVFEVHPISSACLCNLYSSQSKHRSSSACLFDHRVEVIICCCGCELDERGDCTKICEDHNKKHRRSDTDLHQQLCCEKLTLRIRCLHDDDFSNSKDAIHSVALTLEEKLFLAKMINAIVMSKGCDTLCETHVEGLKRYLQNACGQQGLNHDVSSELMWRMLVQDKARIHTRNTHFALSYVDPTKIKVLPRSSENAHSLQFNRLCPLQDDVHKTCCTCRK